MLDGWVARLSNAFAQQGLALWQAARPSKPVLQTIFASVPNFTLSSGSLLSAGEALMCCQSHVMLLPLHIGSFLPLHFGCDHGITS